MDAATAIVVALITAASGLISGLVVAYLKPFAEDRAAATRERRALRQRNLDMMWDALLDATNPARRAMPAIAAAIGDPSLTSHIEQLLAAQDEEEKTRALDGAKVRVGELMGPGRQV